jgi:sulfatase-like protein
MFSTQYAEGDTENNLTMVAGTLASAGKTQMERTMRQCWISATAAVALIVGCTLSQSAFAQRAKPEIIHDAEYYILATQHGEQWVAEDQDIDRKLAELRQKYGTPPNIIHIMWDDTAVGEVGIPAIQKVRGFETPNINRLAAEGINFMRMYTEPSCTPSRAAVLTGRHPVRNGMYNVGFPYEYGGLAASEVTAAEVLSKAGYATAFYGKAHFIRGASSRVSRLVAERRCDAAICPQVSDKRKSLTHARNDLNDPFDTAGQYCCRRAIIFTVFNVITTSSA